MTAPQLGPTERALRLRKRLKQRKPRFVRQESWRYVCLKENWRRPRGLDNKVRKRIKGWPPRVSAGYRGPKGTRALHPSGLEDVLVYNLEDLTKIDSKTQAARISRNVGKRKRTEILSEARKKKIRILNLAQAKETAAKEKEAAEEAGTEEPEAGQAETTEERKKEEKAAKGKMRADKK